MGMTCVTPDLSLSIRVLFLLLSDDNFLLIVRVSVCRCCNGSGCSASKRRAQGKCCARYVGCEQFLASVVY